MKAIFFLVALVLLNTSCAGYMEGFEEYKKQQRTPYFHEASGLVIQEVYGPYVRENLKYFSKNQDDVGIFFRNDPSVSKEKYTSAAVFIYPTDKYEKDIDGLVGEKNRVLGITRTVLKEQSKDFLGCDKQEKVKFEGDDIVSITCDYKRVFGLKTKDMRTTKIITEKDGFYIKFSFDTELSSFDNLKPHLVQMVNDLRSSVWSGPNKLVGNWEGAWDGIWDVRFEITHKIKNQYSITYSWREGAEESMSHDVFTAFADSNGNLYSRSGVIAIKIDETNLNKAIAVGDFPTPRRAALERKGEI